LLFTPGGWGKRRVRGCECAQIDPAQFKGTLAPALATEIIPGNEQLTRIAGRTNAHSAVNGGILSSEQLMARQATSQVFQWRQPREREAVNGRTSLILPDDRARGARVAALMSQQTATATDGATREVGLNRKPGLIRGCGGVGEDIPTTSLSMTLPARTRAN